MKKFLFAVVLGIATIHTTPSASARADTKEVAPAAPAKKTAVKNIPMHARVDAIDAKAGSFTTKGKDGKEVKHLVPAGAEIKNDGKVAKFTDIKVGDFVSGLRIKKNPNEFEVVKITKFGPEVKKAGAKKN